MNCNLLAVIFLPLTLRSTMTSLIIPNASVVLASSKNNTVSMFNPSFCAAIASAFSTFFTISSYVVPPWTYESRVRNLLLNTTFIGHSVLYALFLLRKIQHRFLFQQYLSHTVISRYSRKNIFLERRLSICHKTA